jgi:anti-sigma B factor antagonist
VSSSDRFGQPLAISVEREEDRVRIALAGELDCDSAEDLDRALLAAEASGASEICVDLSRLQFLDSTGLRAILSCELRVSSEGSHLILVPGPPRVQRLFALTGVAQFLHFVDEQSPPDNLSELPGAERD